MKHINIFCINCVIVWNMFDRNKNACKRGLKTALNVFKLLVAVLLIDKIIINREYYYESLRFLL